MFLYWIFSSVNVFRKSNFRQHASLYLLVCLNVIHAAPMTRTGFNATTSFDIKDREYAIDLPFSIRLFGDGKFSKLYVNSVGGVSFGGAVPSSKLDFIKTKVIVFSPLLLMPDVNAHIQAKYFFNNNERDELQRKFRDRTNAKHFVLDNAVVISWNETEGNIYNIYLGTGANERTYLLYDFVDVQRISDGFGFALSGVFAMEDGSILCPVELKGSGTPEISQVSDFHLRVDLPLACDSFNYSCNTVDDTVEEIQEEFSAQWSGYFFETLSVTEWTFYRLYMCVSRLTKEDGSIAIKERCQYDPDYYEYSWTQFTDADKCSRQDPIRIR